MSSIDKCSEHAPGHHHILLNRNLNVDFKPYIGSVTHQSSIASHFWKITYLSSSGLSQLLGPSAI